MGRCTFSCELTSKALSLYLKQVVSSTLRSKYQSKMEAAMNKANRKLGEVDGGPGVSSLLLVGGLLYHRATPLLPCLDKGLLLES